MLAVWLLLLVWQRVAVLIGEVGNLVFLLLVTVPLAMSGIEAAFYRRHAFREQYLRPGWLYDLSGAAPMVLVAELAKALGLALVVMGATLAMDARGWALLLLLVLVLSFLMPRLPGLLRETVNPLYVYPLARRWAIWFGTLFLWLESMLVLMLVEDTDYRGLAWHEAIGYSTSLPIGHGAEGLVAVLQHIDAGVQGAASWAWDHLTHGDGDLATTLIALMALAAVAVLWFVIAWAFSRALVGVTSRPRGVWTPRGPLPSAGHYEPWWY